MATTRTTSHVFINHSHEDDELVRDLVRRMREAGLEPSVDFHAPSVAADWKKTVRQQIQQADAMRVLLTPAALKSPWMMTELGMADGFDRLIVPLTAGLKSSDLPEPLRTYKVVPYDQVDAVLGSLCERMTTVEED